MRSLSVAVVLALAVPALAQPPFGRPGPMRPDAELNKLREQVRQLEAKLKAAERSKGDEKRIEVRVEESKTGDGEKKPEIRVLQIKKPDGEKKPETRKDGDKKPEVKKPEGPRGPMGPGGFGGFGPMGPGGFGMGRGPGMVPPPGFDKLTPDEQATFRKLLEKMGRGGPPERRPDAPRPGGNLEERLERLERMIQELRENMNRGPGGRGGFGGGRGPGR